MKIQCPADGNVVVSWLILPHYKAIFFFFNLTFKFTFAPKASNTFRIVSNLAFFTLFSIFEIGAFWTPTSSPNCICVKFRSCRACLIACPNKSIRNSFSKVSRFSVPRLPMCLSIVFYYNFEFFFTNCKCRVESFIRFIFFFLNSDRFTSQFSMFHTYWRSAFISSANCCRVMFLWVRNKFIRLPTITFAVCVKELCKEK